MMGLFVYDLGPIDEEKVGIFFCSFFFFLVQLNVCLLCFKLFTQPASFV